MPRPKRARRAPRNDARAPESLGDAAHLDHDRGRRRGRPTTGRCMDPQASLGEEHAIRAANRTRDAALDRLADEDATTASVQTPRDDTRSSNEIGRRAVATPAMRRDTTGLDLADDVFGDLDDSFADGDMARRARSADSSSLPMSHFKPRSRQSSIIMRNDAPVRPSSRGPNTPGLGSSLNIGLFRRRAREPSILGTSRNRLSVTEDAMQDCGVESQDDSGPDAESTPPISRPRTRHSLRSGREPSHNQSSSGKRKSLEAHGSSARPETISRVEQDAQGAADSDSEPSVLASPPLPPPAGRPATPINHDEITAPPASSGSEGVAHAWPDIHALAKRRRRPSVASPLRAGNLSDISSPPSLTHSPNYADQRATRPRGRPPGRRREPSKFTTADLTNLLPKRRYRQIRDPFHLDSDQEFDTTGLAQDEDELSYLGARASRRRRGSRPPSRAASTHRGPRTVSHARGSSSVLKPKQTPTSAPRSARNAKTYPRRSSDKENESGGDDEGESAFVPLPDDTFDMDTGETETQGRAFADELKQAAEKFMEVDRWELEFEEVTEPSSPQNAR